MGGLIEGGLIVSEEQKLPWPDYRLRNGWRMLSDGEMIVDGDVFHDCDEWDASTRIGQRVEFGEIYFRRTRPDADLPPVEPIPADLDWRQCYIINPACK